MTLPPYFTFAAAAANSSSGAVIVLSSHDPRDTAGLDEDDEQIIF